MKTLNGIYLFLFFAAIMLNTLANENFTMNNITEIERVFPFPESRPPCIVDTPPLGVVGCAIRFRCPCSCLDVSLEKLKKHNCSDGTQPDEFGNCPVEFGLGPDEEACPIEWPRYPNGSCPEYLTCPNCHCPCPNCQPAHFNGPCPSGTRADKHHHCRQVIKTSN